MQYSRWALTAQSRGAGSPPLPCWPHFLWCSPGYSWLSRLWRHTAGSCPTRHPPVPLGPFQQGCPPSFHPPACTDSRGFWGPGVGPCTWLCWTSLSSPGLPAWACLGLSVRHPFPWGLLAALHSWVSSENLLRVHLIPLAMSLMKIWKSISPSTNPRGRPHITYSQIQSGWKEKCLGSAHLQLRRKQAQCGCVCMWLSFPLCPSNCS